MVARVQEPVMVQVPVHMVGAELCMEIGQAIAAVVVITPIHGRALPLVVVADSHSAF